MVLRFGRLYPLHLAVLVVYFAYELAVARPPFSVPGKSFDTVLANLTLTHGLYRFDFLTWNYPSWSIGAEFFAYLIFASAVITLRRYFWVALALAAVLCPLVLWALVGNMCTTHDYGLIRCLYGFAFGVIAWEAFRRWGSRMMRGTGPELAALALVIAFVSVAGKTPASLLAPVVFCAAVLVFAAQAGAVSKALSARPLLLLGTLSYSIYMVHSFIGVRLHTVAKTVAKATGGDPFAPFTMQEGEYFLGRQLWQGDLYYVVYLGLVIGTSWLTYRFIENPSRAWFRRLADGRLMRKTSTARPQNAAA
jgi:peptidoglycan/LPS O-acetylase OafA/YrhL